MPFLELSRVGQQVQKRIVEHVSKRGIDLLPVEIPLDLLVCRDHINAQRRIETLQDAEYALDQPDGKRAGCQQNQQLRKQVELSNLHGDPRDCGSAEAHDSRGRPR